MREALPSILAGRLSGLTLTTIDPAFGLKNYGSVSSVVSRMKQRLPHERSFRRRVQEIERALSWATSTPDPTMTWAKSRPDPSMMTPFLDVSRSFDQEISKATTEIMIVAVVRISPTCNLESSLNSHPRRCVGYDNLVWGKPLYSITNYPQFPIIMFDYRIHIAYFVT